MFVCAGQSRMMYDFFLYAGKGSTNNTDCYAANVVLRLSERKNFKLCFDNWFCTSPLCLELKSLGILTTATIRANRIVGCPLKCEKDLKKEGRGSTFYRSDANSGIVLVWWFDKKSVQLVFTYSSPATSGTVKLWYQSSKRHKLVPCPDIVKDYNSAMGGGSGPSWYANCALPLTHKNPPIVFKSINSLCRYIQSKFMTGI